MTDSVWYGWWNQRLAEMGSCPINSYAREDGTEVTVTEVTRTNTPPQDDAEPLGIVVRWVRTVYEPDHLAGSRSLMWPASRTYCQIPKHFGL